MLKNYNNKNKEIKEKNSRRKKCNNKRQYIRKKTLKAAKVSVGGVEETKGEEGEATVA